MTTNLGNSGYLELIVHCSRTRREAPTCIEDLEPPHFLCIRTVGRVPRCQRQPIKPLKVFCSQVETFNLLSDIRF